jgi:N-hydroxyarylamine O-acetyltransferase
MIDLDAYFSRIGYAGERTATLDTLRAIVVRHSEAIAFENLDPLRGRPVHLDAASLSHKLVEERRGGYCFEQNLLLSYVLESLGFDVTGLAARVLWNRPDDATMARTHMLLQLRIGGTSYVADVGFGGLTPTAPLRLAPGIEQATPHEPFRLVESGAEFILQARVADGWKSLYRFDLQPQLPVDYQLTNWYVSNHPESRFVTHLVAARPARDRRYALLDDELSVYCLDGTTERHRLAGVREIRTALEEHFLIQLPSGPELDAALERVQARCSACGSGAMQPR